LANFITTTSFQDVTFHVKNAQTVTRFSFHMKTYNVFLYIHVFVFNRYYTTGKGVYNRGMIELQRCTDQNLWDSFILENGGHPLQLWGWGQLKSTHGWSVDRIIGYIDEEPVAAAQILTRKLPMPLRAFSYVPRGPVGEQGTSELFLASIADYTKREHRSVVLSLEPDSSDVVLPSDWHQTKNHILPSQTIILDLNKSENDLLQAMVKKTRQYIRKSAAEAMTIKRVTSKQELEKCMNIYHETSNRAKFSLHNDQYYYDAFNALGEYSPIFAAYVDDQPIAFLWLAITEKTSFELYGGMNTVGQDLRANYALKWHAIRKTKEWGIERYDFGGLINDGVSTFKRSWTDTETTLAGTFDKPLSPLYTVWNKALPLAKRITQRLRSKR
jgi:peptidoglycan pentaglycine glycine transferase (the first glycine)